MVRVLFYADLLPFEQKFARSDVFGELQSTLESAIELCSRYAVENWLKKAFQGSADEGKFDGIVARLGAALNDAQFGLQVDGTSGACACAAVVVVVVVVVAFPFVFRRISFFFSLIFLF